MYICLCKGITDNDIHSAVRSGTSSMKQLRREMGLSSVCGSCALMAKETLNQALLEQANDQASAPPLFTQVA